MTHIHINHPTMSAQVVPNDFVVNQNNIVNDVSYVIYETNNVGSLNQVKLTKNVVSFVLQGSKKLFVNEDATQISESDVLFISKGNCIMQERAASSHSNYKSLLFFFEDAVISEFLKERSIVIEASAQNEFNPKHIVLVKNEAILQFMSRIQEPNMNEQPEQLKKEFKQLLSWCYDNVPGFSNYLAGIIWKAKDIRFKKIVESHALSNLSLEELSFICGMSLSTFKRRFRMKYGCTPGKWFQLKRLQRAKELLESKKVKASDIYLDFGYENLSNFSAALKNTFGMSPRQLKASGSEVLN